MLWLHEVRTVARLMWWRRWPPAVIALLGLTPVFSELSLRVSSGHALPPRYSLSYGWSAAATALVIAVPLLVAFVLAERTETTLAEQAMTDGWAMSRQKFAFAATPAAMCVVAAAVGVMLAVAMQSIDGAVGGAAPLEVEGWVALATRCVVGILILAVALPALGAVVANLTRSRLSALAGVAGLVVAAEALWDAASSFPGLGVLAVATPVGAIEVLARVAPSQQPSYAVLEAVAALASETLLVVAIATRRGATGGATVKVAPLAKRAWHSPAVASGMACAVATAFGAIVPLGLSSEVPWQVRPLWLADLAHHRTSADVAHKFIALVRADEMKAAGAFTTSGSAIATLGPFLLSLQRSGSVQAEVRERAFGDPGQVEVTLDGSARIYLCETRLRSGWRITAVRSDGECPRANVG